MGVRTLTDPEEGKSVLYCSVADTAFGPVFTEPETADDFLDWANGKEDLEDLRLLLPDQLASAITYWRVATTPQPVTGLGTSRVFVNGEEV